MPTAHLLPVQSTSQPQVGPKKRMRICTHCRTTASATYRQSAETVCRLDGELKMRLAAQEGASRHAVEYNSSHGICSEHLSEATAW